MTTTHCLVKAVAARPLRPLPRFVTVHDSAWPITGGQPNEYASSPDIGQQRSLSDATTAQTVGDEAPRLALQPLLPWQCRPCVS
jgi:hypothetical protein